MLLIVCPLVFLAAFIDSIAGGGGLISLPAYYLAGLPPVLASGTNKLSAMLGACVSTYTYARRGCMRWRVVVLAALGALPGSVLGARLLQIVPQDTARIVIILVLPVIAFFVLRSRNSLTPRKRVSDKLAGVTCFLIGLVIGVYDGLIGPGTGTFLILLFISVLGVEQMQALGCARAVNLASNIGALCTMVIGGHVLYGLGLCAAAFSVLGNYLGARCALKGGIRLVKRLLVMVLILIFIKLMVDTFR